VRALDVRRPAPERHERPGAPGPEPAAPAATCHAASAAR